MPAAVLMILLPGLQLGQWTGGPTGPIYYNGGNVGIGTTAPGATLGIHQPSAATAVTHAVFSSPYVNTGDYQQLLFAYDQNNYAVSAGIRAVRYRTADYGASLAFVTSTHDVGGALTERMRIDAFGNVGIGTTNPGTYKLAVEGIIGARDIIVTNTSWSDYVFRPGYRLRPLTEVNAYIQAHHHLPDIPTEAEVKENGVSVGEMQAKLLAKIEELTLHMIRAENDNRELKEANAQLQRVARLEAK